MRPASPTSRDLVLTGSSGPSACPPGLKTFGSKPFGFSLSPHPPTLVSHDRSSLHPMLGQHPYWPLSHHPLLAPWVRPPDGACPQFAGAPNPAPEPPALSPLASPQSTSLKGMST